MKKSVLLCIFCVFLLVLTGCTRVDDPSTNPATQEQIGTTTEIIQSTQATQQEETVSVTEEPIDPNCVIVNTHLGNLQYQDQWTEFMQTEQHREGDNLVVSFSAKIGDTDFALFDIIIGELEEEPVGQITDRKGVVRDVYLELKEIVGTDILTENEKNRLYAMQEDINYIIENLK